MSTKTSHSFRSAFANIFSVLLLILGFLYAGVTSLAVLSATPHFTSVQKFSNFILLGTFLTSLILVVDPINRGSGRWKFLWILVVISVPHVAWRILEIRDQPYKVGAALLFSLFLPVQLFLLLLRTRPPASKDAI